MIQRVVRGMVPASAAILLATQVNASQLWGNFNLDTLGLQLRSWSVVERIDLPFVPPTSAYGQVNDRFDLMWLSFGLVQDAPVAWPRDRVPVLYSGAERIVPVRAFAVGGSPGFLPHSLTWIDPSESWRLRNRRTKELCTVIFAAYPRGSWNPAKVDRVRLERREGGPR